jgi:hypothetical protein
VNGNITASVAITAADAPTTLPIDAGKNVTFTADTLEEVEILTVSGKLTASAATLAAAKEITVSGILDIGGSTAFAPNGNGLAISTTGDGVIKSASTDTDVLLKLLANAKGGATLKIEQGDDVTLTTATVKTGTTLIVAATKTVTVGVGATLTVASGGEIILTGSSVTPAKLVLANAPAANGSATADAGGGGRLTLATPTPSNKVGSSGAVAVSGALTAAKLTAAPPASAANNGVAFQFGGNESELNAGGNSNGDFDNISTSEGKGFNSIEAGTAGGSDGGGNATDGQVTFQAGGASTTVKITNATTVTAGS